MGPEDEPRGGGVGHERLMPAALFYDVDLFATTPQSVLTASAMNGFDKGLEALYTRNSTPITDGTAMRGLRLLRSSLPALGDESEDVDDDTLGQAVTGTILVQYGVSTPGQFKLSLIHAFGHGFTRNYDVHQGRIHAAVAPHVLRYLFHNVNARRELLAEALGVPVDGRSDDELAAGVVDAVIEVRDGLGLPSRLREFDDLHRSEFDVVAETILNDNLIETVPTELDPTADDIVAVLESAW
jgi:alcohol dehydrogenase